LHNPCDKLGLEVPGYWERTMTDRQAIEALIHQAYKAREKGDIEELIAAFHPEAVFELVGSKASLPVAGAVRGQSNVRASLAGFIEVFDFISRNIVSIVIDDRRAAVHSTLEARFKPKNVVFKSDVLDTFRFENGKIIELIEFIDTALIRDVMSADAAATSHM
jgi:ketosteroid isomerase-like protein